MNSQYKENRIKTNYLGLVMLGGYLSFIVYRMFFYAYTSHYRTLLSDRSYNFKPFRTISNFVLHSSNVGLDVFIYNLAGNIAAFVPFGLLLPLALRGIGFFKTLLLSFLFISSAEVLQYISRRGVLDIDDLMLNMLGCLLGFGIYKIFTAVNNIRRYTVR